MKNFTRRFTQTSVCMAVLAGLSVTAQATENFVLRYAPGIGGADMSAPVDPGMYLQVPLFVYHGKIDETSTNTLTSTQLFAGALAGLQPSFSTTTASTPISSKISVDVRALLPRFTYMSTNQWLGATVGFTALLPLMEQRVNVTIGNVGTTTISTPSTAVLSATLNGATGGAIPNTAALAAIANASVAAGASTLAASETGKKWGVGDLEVAPLFRWNRDPDQIVFVPTVILPTGSYDATRAANPGAGKFYTFRPSVQYSHIGDGWDFGARFSYSMNTRNKDTDYKSGNYVNIDFAFMKSLSDAFRVGVQGYVVQQLTKDSYNGAAAASSSQLLTLGKKGHVAALGPSVAWIKGAGELLVEGKVMKEFAAADRPEGAALWLTVAKPIQ